MNAALAQAFRFLVSGGVNTALTYVVYLSLLPSLDYGRAYAVAFVCGIFFSYAISVRFVFRVRANWRSATLFPLIYLVQYLVGLAVLHFAIDTLGVPREYALLASIAVSVPLTFLASRLLFSRLV